MLFKPLSFGFFERFGSRLVQAATTVAKKIKSSISIADFSENFGDFREILRFAEPLQFRRTDLDSREMASLQFMVPHSDVEKSEIPQIILGLLNHPQLFRRDRLAGRD